MAELVVISEAGTSGSVQENEFHWYRLSLMIFSIIKCDKDAHVLSTVFGNVIQNNAHFQGCVRGLTSALKEYCGDKEKRRF